MALAKDDRRMVPEWARGDPLMERYAREVFGQHAPDDDSLFENMCLQVFQAGLNWRMILARREAFRKAFHNWQVDRVSQITSREVEQLMEDSSIIRNRKKIEACIANARVVQKLQREHGSFRHWFYEVLPGNDLVTLQRVLRRQFQFMGPEITRMWLLASGRITNGI